VVVVPVHGIEASPHLPFLGAFRRI
jgi:hypothetical protein